MQIDNAVIDRITQNVLGVFDKALQTRAEVVRAIRDVVKDGVNNFDLVTRDDFEVVNRMLGNTRIKLDALEQRVAELEAAVAAHEEQKG